MIVVARQQHRGGAGESVCAARDADSPGPLIVVGYGDRGIHSPGRPVVDDQEGHDGRVYYSHLLDALRSR